MADYLTVARSNYFKVKSPTAFEEMLERFGLGPAGKGRFAEFEYHRDDSGAYCVFGQGVNTSINLDLFDNNDDIVVDSKGNEVTLFIKIQKHLAKGVKAVFEEVGYEKCRYVVGYVAVITSKEVRIKSLDDIARELGVWEEVQ